jgi:hypothetical protein
MALGDITFFEEALATMLDGDWAATDEFWVAIVDTTVDPTAADAAPVIGDYTQVTDAGTYVSGGLNIGALSVLAVEAGGVMTFNSAEADPTWAKDASNDVDAYWAIVYNKTDATNDCLLFVDLDGPMNMAAGALTIAWHASGLFTITAT